MTKRFYSIFILSVCLASCVGAFAQDYKGPDLQTTNDGFFDPTRKQKKQREEYHFAMEYRLQLDYIQNDLRFPKDTARYGLQHGPRLGANFDFLLPYGFSAQVGLFYSFAYGYYQQHWGTVTQESMQVEYIDHRVFHHELSIPIRVYARIPFKNEFGMFFYSGPQLNIGLSANDRMDTHISDPTRQWLISRNILVDTYDRYASGEYRRFCIQYGIGGGFDLKQFRIEAGYDFGLNNIASRMPNHQKIWQWQWHIGLAYRLK